MSVFELEAEGGIGLLRINRPEKRNALTDEMVEELGTLCRKIERREDIRVLILTGTDGAFCAGGDIEAWAGQSPAAFARHWVRDGHASFDALAQLRQPVIAVLGGHALGGGLELAACADLRIAEAQVKIGQPEAGLGIIPGWSGTQRAARRFGAQTVRRMALLGEVFTAEEAQRLGIVDHVVPTGQGLSHAQNLAANVLTRSPQATELIKMMVNAADGEDTDRILEALAGRIAAGSEDLAEGLASFRGKRRPDFGGSR
jgi:enoyl-CoA hydratase/carnithine racemase